MDNRRKHTKRVFAMLLAFIMCLSQAVTAAADEVNANETVPETVSEESTPPEETVSEEAAPEEPEEAVSGEALPGEPEEAAGEVEPVSGNFKYKVSENDEVIILGHINGTSATGKLDIPASINGMRVTAIGDGAFSGCRKLTGSLTIPDGVTTIGASAFEDCYRFNGDLTIPDSVTTIGDSAFKYCSGFTGALTIPGNVTTIGDNAFDGCYGFNGALTISGNVTTIGASAFEDCYGFNGALTIPGNVTTIGDAAFKGCKGFTGDLTIGNSVKTIGKDAFNYCEGFNGSLKIGNKVATISNNAFLNCKGLSGNLTIPDSVTTIGDAAFSGCKGFTGDLTIGNSVKTIGDQAFGGCEGFTGTLTIPESVTTLGGETGNHVFDHFSVSISVIRMNSSAELNLSGFFDGSVTVCFTDISGNEYKGGLYSSPRTYYRKVKPESISLDKTLEGYERETKTLSVNVSPDNAYDKAIWTSSDESVAKVDNNGKVTFTGPGKTDITAEITTKFGTIKSEPCKVTVKYIYDDKLICTYTDDKKGVIILGHRDGASASGDLVIPGEIDGKPVTAIGDGAFDGCYEISRIINNSTKSLSVNWFWKNDDTTTICFKDAGGTKIYKGQFLGTGTYQRKIDTPATGVSLNKTSLEVNVGTPETLIATVSPSNTYWDEVSWNSSDKTVATVSNGVVTGLKPGNTVITVTTVSKNYSASCNVTVKRIPVTGVTLDKSTLSMYPGETETLTATVTPAEASQAVRWFSSNEKVATVDNGKVTSISPGSATITVSTNDGGFTATCAVRVFTKATAHKVTFKNEDGSTFATQTVENGKQATDPGSPSKPGYIFIGWSDGTSIWNFTTPVNKDLTLIAKYKAEQAVVSENTGSGMDPTPVVDEPEKKGEKTTYKLYLVKGQTFTAGGKGWTTSDKTIANVAANTGKITAKGKGTAIVTNDTTEYTVYVAAPSVSKNSKTVTVLVGQSAEVGIDLQAVEGKESKYPITWYSANPKVAAVNGGMVTGIAKGSAKVTAYIGGKAYSATVKVIDTCKAPSKIKENKAEFSMNPLQSFNVKFDSNVFTIKNAVWSGNGLKEVKNGYENNVISITKSGKFTAIGPGTTTVTGTDKNSKTVTVTVTVKPISTMGMVYITKGKTDTIKFPKVTNKKADWWKSSNEKAATVDTSKKNGKVKGIDYGTSDISCLYKGFTFNTPVYVEDPGMVFGGKEVKNKEKLEMKVGEMKQLKINKTYQTLNFKSSKQANVFVDENGFVYARKKGKANISTKINGTTYKIAVEVTE